MSPPPSPDRYVVMGNPIGHSKSPQIHQLFAAQTGAAISYEKMLVPIGGLGEALAAFATQGGCGANITVPFKHDACRVVDAVSERARRASAVNTVRVDADGLYGDNTDGVGLLKDLTDNLGCAINTKNILLIGAGGAASGVIGPLLDEDPLQLTITNRTVSKAKALAESFADLGNVTPSGFDGLGDDHFDLVINATSAGLRSDRPEVPETVIGAQTWCYDLMYADRPTAFMQWGEELGARAVTDGLGMLVEQAAESYRIWRGNRPDTQAVIRTLRTEH